MVSSSAHRLRQLVKGRAPDPLRAHGAWVYLLLSILAGALTALGRGPLAPVLAGTAFAGAFLLAGGLAVRGRQRTRRLLGGLLVSTIAVGLALLSGADPMFLRFGLVALFPACAAAFLAARNGYHSPPALALGVCALVLAAPCAACAGGASLPGMGLLVLLLLPFFAWRTTRLGTALRRDGGLTRAALRQRGLVEALLALGWTAVAVGLVHLLA